ncbi:ABC transporter substrate-binding protein [Lactonifactor longoviformis]|uniref:ABC transporter substrate-binding protein n=1 Tax=Lactonifactor longoviformis TaxID=341220 RepID=UPI001D02A877|nr:ABC transporter substrate-binding protein [Lactonifactor longoviformis]MCB5714164.1 ABC transporter substrate-binding protein [Lactonifactor longoviformis]MCB5718350.1 ABC transporter substrate-binding protein [Lactonifactor longoviformis]
MKKKKWCSFFLAVCLCAFMLSGCGTGKSSQSEDNSKKTEQKEDNSEKEAVENTADTSERTGVRIGALKGPTAMGMAQMLDDTQYEFSIAASPDEIVPLIVQGQLDIAAVPANLSSVLYQKTNKQVSVMAVNTLGILYLVENGEAVKTAEDLKGKTIYASGKGATPEYALNYVLSANGIDPRKDVTIEYKSEHAEVVAALAADQTAVGLLPQPFVTTALMKNKGLRVALDLNDLWESSQEEGSRLVTGVIIVRNEFLQENPEKVNKFLDAYKASVDFVNSDAEAASVIIDAHDIVAKEVAVKAIPECSITFVEGQEMKTMLSGYLETLLDQNPETIGGAMPDDDFYFQR